MCPQHADDAVSRRKKTDEISPDDRGEWCSVSRVTFVYKGGQWNLCHSGAACMQCSSYQLLTCSRCLLVDQSICIN